MRTAPNMPGFLIDGHICYRPSLLVQGGLKIPVRVTVDMDIGDSNTRVLKKYEELVVEHYKEPENGMFYDVTRRMTILTVNQDPKLSSSSTTY